MSEKNKRSESMKGNLNRVAIKDEQVRQMAYASYCEHLSKGKSKKSWYFDNEEYPNCRCTWETMEKYIKDTSEFDPLKKKFAESKGYAHWESVVEDSAIGKNTKANTATLQMLMRNKYGWDKQTNKDSDGESGYDQSFNAVMLQLKTLQNARKMVESSDSNDAKSA